jgi:hypothetical protein
MLMDEVDVEGDPIFHSIERRMKHDTNRALFLESKNDLCMSILDDIEGWMSQQLEHSDDPMTHRENENVNASRLFAISIHMNRMQRQDALIAYNCYCIVSIGYTIAATKLSLHQCKSIPSPVICATLNKMGINRNIS